jgi:hypothetical protein
MGKAYTKEKLDILIQRKNWKGIYKGKDGKGIYKGRKEYEINGKDIYKGKLGMCIQSNQREENKWEMYIQKKNEKDMKGKMENLYTKEKLERCIRRDNWKGIYKGIMG